MKSFSILISSALIIMALFSIQGCKYDVAEPAYYDPITYPDGAGITSVDPAAGAGPGVNTITIHGKNFENVPDSCVYFNSYKAEVVSNTGTAITVRRPNLVTDNCEIKVVSYSDIGVAAKYPNYKIEKIIDQYGSFLENLPLGGLDIDNNENLYVMAGDTSRRIFKVTPSGDKTLIGRANRNITNGKIGPDGRIYLLGANREIDVIDPAAASDNNESVRWHRLSASRQLRVGGFDSQGNFYAGGNKTDLWIISPDGSTGTATNLFTQDTILSVHAYTVQGTEYLYLTVATPTGKEIQRYPIGAGPTLGAKELVANLSAFGPQDLTDFTIIENGNLFISTNSGDPLFINDPASNNADYYYKDIVPAYIKQMVMGNGTYLYIMKGDATAGESWSVYRVDLGAQKADGFK